MLKIIYISCFIVSAFGTWGTMKYAHKLGFMDTPNGRSSHGEPTPKGGGVGILAALLVGCLFFRVESQLWGTAIVISLASLWGGDKHRLSVRVRLIIQFVCSFYFLAPFILQHGSLGFLLLGIFMAFFIVGTTNFYNFMDGIDGIAGVTGVIGFGLLYFYSGLNGSDRVYGELCMVLVIACLGFLCFNFPKARVFLGDVGSILLGFLFACMVILIFQDLLDFIVMVGFLAPFYYDELFTMVTRAKAGDSILVPHRKHVYQLLVNECGVRHWKISATYGAVQGLVGISGILAASKGLFPVVFVYMIFGLIFFILSKAIRKRAGQKFL